MHSQRHIETHSLTHYLPIYLKWDNYVKDDDRMSLALSGLTEPTLYGAEIELLKESYVNTMIADDLAPASPGHQQPWNWLGM